MNDTTRRLFFEPVREAMQSAEELGGPENQEYMDLMDAIIEEAQKRKAAFYRANHWD